jgi:hypothetical protein
MMGETFWLENAPTEDNDDLGIEDGLTEDNDDLGIEDGLCYIPFGKDGTDGDSSFYPGDEDLNNKYVGQSFEELYEQWKMNEAKKSGYDSSQQWMADEEITEEDIVAGFWVVTSGTLTTALQAWPDEGVGSDSACYMLNRAVKTILKNSAVKVLVERGKKG